MTLIYKRVCNLLQKMLNFVTMTENMQHNDFMTDENKSVLTKSWFLTAGETDARGLMPVTLVAARAIEVATEHANVLGIGYADLKEHRLGWVLARLTIEMKRYPRINETYTMSTWIEGYNRRFSDRCFEMTDADGNTVANIRSMWVAIDMETRAMADLTQVETGRYPIVDRPCPVAKDRIPSIEKDAVVEAGTYTFRYCDIDFNRHVNTIRYLDLVLNQRSLEFYDHNSIDRLSVSFDHECYFGETVRLLTGPAAREAESSVTEIHAEGRRAVGVKLHFMPREQAE